MDHVITAALGPMEILLILVVVLLLFGTTRLPQLGSGLGRFFRNLRSSLKEEDGSGGDNASPPRE